MQTSHAAWGDVVLFEAASQEDAAAKLEGEDVKVEADADAMPSKIVAVAPSVLPRDVDASDIVAGEPVRRGQAARALVLATKARMMLPMLNDTLRNEAYERAIVEEVRAFAAIHGRGPRVLDIGAGTGLLSVMAARAGAREVVGCEMNGVMAAVAQDVVRANGLDGCVKILACRSTEFSLDAEEEPFDLVVTETLDSHLLREGILPSLADALDRLARPGAAVVPKKARIYAQLCNTEVGRTGVGELVVRDDKVLGLSERRTSRLPTPKDRDGHTDIKFSSRDEMHKMILLGTVEKVFDIAFADAKSIEEFIRCEPSSMISSDDKTANAVCVWWELDVHAGSEDAPDPEPKRPRLEGDKAVQTVQTRNCPLTNMPNIPETEAQWQDHWFPVVYPLVEAGPSIEVGFGRTETEIFVQQLEWKPAPAETSAITTELNTCMDPLRLLQVVDHERQEAIRGGLETLVEAQTCSTIHLWDVGSGSLVAFVAAQFEKICAVKSLETDYFSLCSSARARDVGSNSSTSPTLVYGRDAKAHANYILDFGNFIA
ncbi:Protein arginine N-methyltransferase 7 [Hondaea fermentalgiana]|uniref:Protein arginine N-methyltransferase 7 n=1 Tax=Hondaea fermentalgiana TaxID=2315210 RepID=A0A2R5GIQ4_9STRA|nr:Protein arginine N-methyltransferase 7 [Hondaea fermentalgiana]|eukprot:GBG28171.1 Protein arginine N-methyltransferase 7 [Hondaea fermentalgiana]